MQLERARLVFASHSVGFSSAIPGVLGFLNDFWGQFLSEGEGPVDVELHVAQEPGGFSGQADFRQFNNGGLLVMAAATKMVTVSFAARPWQGYVQVFRDHPPAEVYHVLLEPTLVLVLKRLSWFYGHCSCVNFAGRGMLMPGSSGCGKTTTSTQLLLHGAEHISDDRVLLFHGPDGMVEAHRVEKRAHLSLCLDTPELFPEADAVRRAPEYQKGRRSKRYFDVAAHHPEQVRQSCQIGLVLFPRVAAGEETRLRKMDAAEALLRWMAQEPIEYHTLLADRLADRAQFGLLSHLAGSVPCYELVLGTAMDRLPDLIHSLPS